MTGSAAMRQAREDKHNIGHPSRMARRELQQVFLIIIFAI